jgi:hypothetical protein
MSNGTDFGGQNVIARSTQRVADAALTKALAVIRSGIEIAKAVGPSGCQNICSIFIANLVIQIPERCTAETQSIYRQFSISYLMFLETAHCLGQV